jgi:copper homeostasis protein
MIIEACVERFEYAMKAGELGANRIELCSRLDLGGLTPTFELMKKTCSSLKIPVMVMIRPRAGGFVYSEAEIKQMKTEIGLAKKAGAAGVVFGLLTKDNKIDSGNTKILAEFAKPLEVTFHKAIDQLDDPVKGVHELKKIKGITRILTSGGKATAMEGSGKIREMIAEAGRQITIVVAGKVTDKNLQEIGQITSAKEFHGRKIAGELE